MQPWRKESAFFRLFEQELSCRHSRRLEAEPRTIERTASDLKTRIDRGNQLLVQGIDTLNGLASCFQRDKNLAAAVRQLRDVMRLVHERLGTDIPAIEQYRLIHPFMAWFTKNSSASFLALSERDPLTFVFLLHMYAAVVTLAVALPAIDFPFFASMRITGILEIRRAVLSQPGFMCTACNTVHSS